MWIGRTGPTTRTKVAKTASHRHLGSLLGCTCLNVVHAKQGPGPCVWPAVGFDAKQKFHPARLAYKDGILRDPPFETNGRIAMLYSSEQPLFWINILRCAQRSLSQLSRPAVNVQSRNCRRVWLEPALDQIQYRPSFYALKQNHVCICTCVFRATGWLRKLAYPRRMRDPSLIS